MSKTTNPPPAHPKPVVIPEKILREVEGMWVSRCKTGHIKTTGKRYTNMEADFFAGAYAGLLAINPRFQTPVRWYIAAIRGDRIVPAERFKAATP